MNYLVIFFVSFLCILLELFWTRILNLKAWNHVVYTVIPFAILGYGIGANIHLILSRKIALLKPGRLLGMLLLVLGGIVMACTLAIIRLPVHVRHLLNIFVSFKAAGFLLLAYILFMLPFVVIGFIVVYLFSSTPRDMHKLYCVDLVGAALGAGIFFLLIDRFAVVHSLFALSILAAVIGYLILFKGKKKFAAAVAFVLLFVLVMRAPEPVNYVVDPQKGWEWIPGYFKATDYQTVSTRWHALGRTDIFCVTSPDARAYMVKSSPGTFQINVTSSPEFAYFSTNFLAGTPAFNFAKFGPESVNTFTCSMETPYLLVKEPRVMIIGVGGGRDIFMARSHGAKEIHGAEINPGIVRAMSRGGEIYDYSGHIYDSAKVSLIDGRHLVKTAPKDHYDLVILNGVDTFSGLSSGAYAYAESYLYTKNALMDYLGVLNDGGIINFNRWIFVPPRETLRLMAITLEALKDAGAERPWDHILVGEHQGWSLTLIKKTPFSPEEVRKVVNYFHKMGAHLLYPSAMDVKITGHPWKFFDLYAETFKVGNQRAFAHLYPYDISVVTDDNPFFYKYYKFHWKDIFAAQAVHHTGSVIFLTQFLILSQALLFIVLFIVLPLSLSKETDIRQIPQKRVVPIITYFACLGLGFMFIELPFMQKFVLLLGSPIHSISIVLAGLLFWTGIGSFLVPRIRTLLLDDDRAVVTAAAGGLLAVLFLYIFAGETIQGMAMGWPFILRAVFVGVLMAPAGILLGIFFPLGLRLVNSFGRSAIAWGWGINCGFSVLGSILAVIIAQFTGFNTVLFLSCIVYLIAVLSFRRTQE